MKHLFTILALITGCAIASPSVADDLIVSRAVLEDPAGKLTIADVMGGEFKPIGQTLSRGFTDSVHWLRLHVRAPAKGGQVVLFIRQPYLNEIRLYEADAGDPTGWKTRVTGNYYPYDERDRARTSLGFVVNITAPEAVYYLRLRTNSVSQLTVEALESAEAERKDDQFDLLAVFFTTAMLLLLLWAIQSYLLDRQRVVGLFAIHQAVYTLYGIAVTGYLAPLIPAGFPRLVDLSTAIPYCGVCFTTLLFCRELFKSYEPPPLLMRGLNLFLLAFPLELAAMAFGYTPFAVILNALLIRISWWYFVIMTFTLRREQAPRRRLLQFFFVTITVLFTLFWFANRSTVTGTKNNLYGRQILIANGLIIGGIFAMILNARSRRLVLEAQQSALELQAKSDFLALVSHEIRTPLNALVGFSTLARTASDPTKLNQYHAILEQSSRSLMELVNGILDMSKIEARRMEIETVPLNMRQLAAGLEEQYHHLADQKKLAFQMVMADNVPAWVLGDPVRLRQILANLLANAVKFTERGGVSCSVSVRQVDETHSLVRFEVRDTGIGIPETSRAQLFQPFRQLDPTISRKFGGTGLGLAIVQSLVVMMKGNLTVDSREGEGSCFVVELPLQETDPVLDDLAPVVALASGSILVVEDNEFNRRLLGDILTSWGQQVMLAEEGWQALQFMEQQRFDLVLLDIRMPDIDGVEVARRVRRRELERSETPVPIIAITAEADRTTRAACLAAGINAVLAKPIIPEQLARTIAAHWTGAGAGASTPGKELLLNVQTYGDLAKNPERARQYRELLMQDINEELQCLKAAIERDHRCDVGRFTHTLRGLCGHLANPESAELATWLQENALSAPLEEMRQVIEKLRNTCQCGLVQEDKP